MLQGGTGKQIQDILSAGKKISTFDFWSSLTRNVQATSNEVTQKYGKGITVSIVDPSNPNKPIYSVRDGKVLFNIGVSRSNVN